LKIGELLRVLVLVGINGRAVVVRQLAVEPETSRGSQKPGPRAVVGAMTAQR